MLELLPPIDAVVCHSGTNTVGEALANPRMPGTLGLTIASGVDMPGSRSLPYSASRCRQQSVSASWLWCASSMSASVRFLDERFIDPADVSDVELAVA